MVNLIVLFATIVYSSISISPYRLISRASGPPPVHYLLIRGCEPNPLKGRCCDRGLLGVTYPAPSEEMVRSPCNEIFPGHEKVVFCGRRNIYTVGNTSVGVDSESLPAISDLVGHARHCLVVPTYSCDSSSAHTTPPTSNPPAEKTQTSTQQHISIRFNTTQYQPHIINY